MRRILTATLLICLICLATSAIPITLFMDTNTFLERAEEIIVAECISVPRQETRRDGPQAVEVNILRVLQTSPL
jgi:hypothetical protein